MKTRFQLFTCYNIELPDSILNTSNGSRVLCQKVPSFPFIRWPNGRPCELVNMYLLAIAHQITGDTLKTYASQLTHLVRYCARNEVSFFDLTDSHFLELSHHLLNEKMPFSSNRQIRNGTTVKNILVRSFMFLIWFQESCLLTTDQRLIDERPKSPKIAVKFKTNHYRRKKSNYVTHISFPEEVSKLLKRPIARSVIEDVEDMIEKLADASKLNEPTSRRYKFDPEFYYSQLNYIRARRRFMIWLFCRTGMRPSEMVELELSDHIDVSNTLRLVIPTKKRRKSKIPKRAFPITLKDSQVIERYLIVRKKYLKALHAKEYPMVSDALFLTAKGAPLKKSSLEKDFSRIVKLCGYGDTQICVSMFRHRFITYEVIAHLKEFMVGSGKTRQVMTDSDYRSILRRVATKTGHGCEDSLWHYIDLAWGELNVWGGIDAAIQRYHAADHLFSDLLDLKSSLSDLACRSDTDVIELVARKLTEILSSAKPLLPVGH